MSLIKDAVANVFSSLNYTREEREKKFADSVTEMRESINAIIVYHTSELLEELTNFDESNWIVGDECGKTILFLKDLSPNRCEDFGKMEVAMKETGEVWVRIILDNVFSDGFEPAFLKARERTLIPALETMVTEAEARIGLAGLMLEYKGKSILAK